MINKILEEIFNFRSTKIKKNIDYLKEIYKILGSPCINSKIIHIAGTNGKGSTATFIEQILMKAGLNICKFTSPHILKYNERIIYNNKMIDDKTIIENYYKIIKAINTYNSNISSTYELNFFEITFFIALLFFETVQHDFIILETGLGGRLDATNIMNSQIAVITNISFDHTSILGNTLKEIAFEKSGIIKNNQLCLYTQNSNELEDEISKQTNNSINLLKKYNYNILLDKQNFKTIIKINNNKFIIPLFGKFQGENFLIAYEIAKMLNIDDETIQRGIDNVNWQGRFEIFNENPLTILDVAHNDDSIKKLCDNLSIVYKKNEIIIIVSVLETKDLNNILSQLKNFTNKIFITSLKDVTYGLTSKEIKDKMLSFNMNINNIIFEDDILTAYEEAKNLIIKNNMYKSIVVCGSFYEISKFKKFIKKDE